MTYRQKALNKLKERRDMLIDLIILRTAYILAGLSIIGSIISVINNWEVITFIFGG